MRMLRMVLCFGLVAALLPAVSQAQDNEPAFPDSTWVRLAPADIESQPDFSAFGDVYHGESSEWARSPYAMSYIADTDPRTVEEIITELRRLKEILAASGNFDEANGPLIRSKLTQGIDSLIAGLFRTADGSEEKRMSWAALDQAVDLDGLQTASSRWRGSDIEGALGNEVRSNTIIFAGRSYQIVLLATQGTGFGSFEPFVYFATVRQAIEVRAVQDRVRKLFNKAYVGKLDDTLVRLKKIDEAWDTYLSKGFSQYPWEFLINSHAVGYSWSRPPAWQLVFIHPEASTIVDVRKSSTVQTQSTILVHGIGFVRYFGDGRRWFWGNSLSASIPGGGELGLGVGMTCHFGHAGMYSKLPHISIGVLWHDLERESHGPIIVLSADLWRLVSKGGGKELFKNLEVEKLFRKGVEKGTED